MCQAAAHGGPLSSRATATLRHAAGVVPLFSRPRRSSRKGATPASRCRRGSGTGAQDRASFLAALPSSCRSRCATPWPLPHHAEPWYMRSAAQLGTVTWQCGTRLRISVMALPPAAAAAALLALPPPAPSSLPAAAVLQVRVRTQGPWPLAALAAGLASAVGSAAVVHQSCGAGGARSWGGGSSGAAGTRTDGPPTGPRFAVGQHSRRVRTYTTTHRQASRSTPPPTGTA